MNLKKILQIGEKLEVYCDENDMCPKYYSMLQDIIDENDIIITIPMSNKTQATLILGQEVEITFFRDEAKFIFRARVIEHLKNENVDLLKLNRISPITRIQRRNYYRLKITLPIFIRLLNYYSNQDPNLEGWLKAYTLNLSGGGVKISFDRNLEEESLLECKLKINDEDLILKGKVVRCQLVEKDPIIRYEIGIAFIDITEYQRDLIIRFIFEEQRKLRKKGFI